MPKPFIIARHCKNPKCSRLIRTQNKSGYCCKCYRLDFQKRKGRLNKNDFNSNF